MKLRIILLGILLACGLWAQAQPAPAATDQTASLMAEVQALRAEVATLSAAHTVAAYGPYETIAVELIKFFSKVIDSQPPEVRAELWRGYLEDVKAWRDFWRTFRSGLGDAFKESAK